MAFKQGVQAPQAPPTADSGSDEDGEVVLEHLGSFRDNIVGIQYYTGYVGVNEMVVFVREPDNMYDSWAIRVDNVLGEKVGHLPRVLVCHLAPLIDQGIMQIEGVVPRGTQNKFKMPGDVHVFCEQHNRRRVELALAAAGKSVGQASGGGGGAASPQGPERLSAREAEDCIDRMFDELLQQRGPQQQLGPSPAVLTPLFPHQKQALAWMAHRENSNALPPFWEPRMSPGGGAKLVYANQLTNFIASQRPKPMRGGILADDMGLGKTLQVISLIATNRPGVQQLQYYVPEPDAQPEEVATQEGEEEEGRPKKRQKKGGKQAAAAPGSLMKKSQSAAKGKAAQLEAHAAELAAAAEGAPALPAAGGPKGTLIVCPLTVLTNWQSQLEEHTAGGLTCYTYYGADRDRRVSFLQQHDVVLTTYNILATEIGLGNGVLKASWLRVVLDEAHTIRNPKTQMAKAAAALKGERRWAISGTPIQNSLQDLHGVCAFLGLEPLNDRSLFMRTIEGPIKNRDAAGLKRLQVLMAHVALRRTKTMQVGGRPLIALPLRSVQVVEVELGREARAKYERWEEAGRRVIQRHLDEGTLLQNFTAVLEIMLRLRQICDDPSLAPGEDPVFASEGPQSAQLTPEVQAQLVALLKAGLDENECPVCLDPLSSPVITLCRHIFCKRCITEVIARDKPSCPLCRGALSQAGLVELPEEEMQPPEPPAGTAGTAAGGSRGVGYSAKVASLLERLRSDAGAGSSAGGAPVKAVVFSQFTSYLDLVQPVLEAEGFSCARLDGRTPAARRGQVLRSFQSGGADPGPTVLLLSLKAGGVGLNLTAASRVHMLDPWWNPSVEEQAMDRVHRLGQTREVVVYRYTVRGSIEERILAMQEDKKDLMKVAFDRKRAEEMRAARIQDVRILMEL